MSQIINEKSLAIREKYKIMRQELSNCFAKDLLYDSKVLDKKAYRIARRKIVLLRQKELLEGGFLINDEMLDENKNPTGKYELDWINEELLIGVKDRALLCPNDPYPHQVYPKKVV